MSARLKSGPGLIAVLGVSLAALAISGSYSIVSDEAPAATATTSRLKPKVGVYRGKTAQGGRVAFRVRNGRVKSPSYTVYNRRCGVKITFPLTRKVNRKGRFFFGQKSSDFFTGRFVTRGKVRGEAAVDFSDSSCPGRGVKDVRFRAKRVRVR